MVLHPRRASHSRHPVILERTRPRKGPAPQYNIGTPGRATGIAQNGVAVQVPHWTTHQKDLTSKTSDCDPYLNQLPAEVRPRARDLTCVSLRKAEGTILAGPSRRRSRGPVQTGAPEKGTRSGIPRTFPRERYRRRQVPVRLAAEFQTPHPYPNPCCPAARRRYSGVHPSHPH